MTEVNQQQPITLAPPMRMHHLTGGLSLLIASSRVCMLLSPGGPGATFFSLPANVPVSHLLEGQRRLRILGFTQFNVAEQMQDSVVSSFAITPPNSKDCLST